MFTYFVSMINERTWNSIEKMYADRSMFLQEAGGFPKCEQLPPLAE